MSLIKSKLLPEQMDKTPNKYWTLCICLILTLATFAVYWQVHRFEFVGYDDNKYIIENLDVQAGLSSDSIIWAFTTRYFSNWHPLTWLSHMLDCELFGLNAGRHHLTNLLLHIANTLLLFIVLKRMTSALWQSAFVAAAFALHPLHVESVAWIAERKDVLSTLFWLLTMAAYLRYAKRPGISWYVLTLLAFALGLMAKPMLVTLPFVLLLLDYWPLGRFQNGQNVKDDEQPGREFPDSRFQRQTLYRLVLEKVPFFALSAVSSIVTFLSQQTGTAVIELQRLPVISRIANAVISYVKYMGKMIWPGRLAVLYPHSFSAAISLWWTAGAVLILLIISVCVIWLARNHKFLPVGWLWYLGTLVPVIGLVQVGGQAMADRYTYVPLTGLFIIIAWAVPQLVARWRYKKISLAAAAVVLASAMMVCTWRQVGHWQNSYTLFSHTLAVTKNNYFMHYNLAVKLADDGRFDEAVGHYRQSLQINPNYFNANNNLGIILFEQSKYDEAVACFNQALRIRPDAVDVHNRTGIALLGRARFAQAVPHFLKVLESEPNSPEIYLNLGSAFTFQGKLGEAVKYYSSALQIDPDSAKAHNGMGIALLAKGNLTQAVTHFTKAAEIDPNFAHPHRNLAKAFLQQGKLNQAVEHYTEALQIRPDWVDPMNSLARLMAVHKRAGFYNPQQALRLARRACELTNYTQPGFLDTLSVAYAAAGRFDEAVATAEKALELALASGQTKLAEEIRKHLRLYKAGEPYIDTSQKTSSG